MAYNSKGGHAPLRPARGLPPAKGAGCAGPKGGAAFNTFGGRKPCCHGGHVGHDFGRGNDEINMIEVWKKKGLHCNKKNVFVEISSQQNELKLL